MSTNTELTAIERYEIQVAQQTNVFCDDVNGFIDEQVIQLADQTSETYYECRMHLLKLLKDFAEQNLEGEGTGKWKIH